MVARKKMNENESVSPTIKWFVFAGIAILLLLRLFGLGQMLADDENANMNAVVGIPYGSDFSIIPHPPMVAFIYSLGGFFWGHIGVRIVCWLIGISSILLTYWLARRINGERTALFAVSILAVAFWHVFDSVQINVENVFSLVILIATIGYFRYLWQPSLRSALFAGALLGAAFLTKYSAVLLAGAIGIHWLWLLWENQRSRSALFLEHVALFGIPLVMLALYFVSAFLSHSVYGSSTLAHGAGYLSGFFSQDLLNVLSILIQALFFISPLLLGLLLLSVSKYDPRHRFLYILIAVFIFFYLFVISVSYRAFERFWAPLLPAIAIVCGAFLARIQWSRRDAITVAFFAMGSYLALLALQLTPGFIFPLYPKSEYIARVLLFQWEFYVPFHSSTGPFGFFVEFGTMMAGFIASAVALAIYAFVKNPRWSRTALLLFLGIGLAYNAVLLQEYYVSPTSPDINGVSWEVTHYVLENIPSDRKISTYQFFGMYFFREYDMTYFGFHAQDDPATNEWLSQTDRTLIIIDYPVIPKDSVFWKTINECALERSFADKGHTMGYVFDCRNRSNAIFEE